MLHTHMHTHTHTHTRISEAVAVNQKIQIDEPIEGNDSGNNLLPSSGVRSRSLSYPGENNPPSFPLIELPQHQTDVSAKPESEIMESSMVC